MIGISVIRPVRLTGEILHESYNACQHPAELMLSLWVSDGRMWSPIGCEPAATLDHFDVLLSDRVSVLTETSTATKPTMQVITNELTKAIAIIGAIGLENHIVAKIEIRTENNTAEIVTIIRPDRCSASLPMPALCLLRRMINRKAGAISRLTRSGNADATCGSPRQTFPATETAARSAPSAVPTRASATDKRRFHAVNSLMQ